MTYKKSGSVYENLKKVIGDFSRWQSKTGWPASAAYEDGTQAGDVARYQEYGTSGGIPPRPFIRIAITGNQGKWLQSMAIGTLAAIAGNLDAKTVLENTALIAAGDIANSIKSLTEPKLKQATIARKGFAKPLIDTGLMIKSVTGIAEEKQ